MKIHRAFTLIELLVVISIIALLIALLLPALGLARKSGQDTQCRSNVKSMGIASIAWANEYRGEWVPTNPTTPGGGVLTVWNAGVSDLPVIGQYRGEGILADKGYYDANGFYCPRNTIDYAYNKASDKYPVSGWFDDPANLPAGKSSMETNYLYRSTIPGRSREYGDLSSNDRRPANLEDPSDWAVYADVFSGHTGERGVDNHHLDGYNVLFTDGHVEFVQDTGRVIYDLKGGNIYNTDYAALEQAWIWLATGELTP